MVGRVKKQAVDLDIREFEVRIWYTDKIYFCEQNGYLLPLSAFDDVNKKRPSFRDCLQRLVRDIVVLVVNQAAFLKSEWSIEFTNPWNDNRECILASIKTDIPVGEFYSPEIALVSPEDMLTATIADQVLIIRDKMTPEFGHVIK